MGIGKHREVPGTSRNPASEDLIERESSSVYDRVEDLIGCVEGGSPDLSQSTGRKFRELLETKAR